jgi:hypothetical protein
VSTYSHLDTSKHSLADCEAAVGKQAKLVLTGEIVRAGESGAGPYVVFQADEKWGFPTRLGFDLEVFEIEP